MLLKSTGLSPQARLLYLSTDLANLDPLILKLTPHEFDVPVLSLEHLDSAFADATR